MKTLANNELAFIRELLGKLISVPGNKIAYASAKTIRLIQQQEKVLQSMKDHTEGYTKYLEAIEAVKLKFATKKKNGKPEYKRHTKEDGSVELLYDFKDHKGLLEELKKLEDEFTDAIEEQVVRMNNYTERMQQEADVAFFHINMIDLKGLNLTPIQWTASLFLVENPKISIKDVPDGATQEEMQILIDYFDL